MEKKKLYFFIFGIILFALIILLLFSSSIIPIFQKEVQGEEKILHMQKLFIELEVVESHIIGINIDKNNTHLKFGQVGRGTTSTKKITIINPFNENVNVFFEVDENISRFIYSNESDFILNEGRNRTISISAHVNKTEEFGNYSGFLTVIMKKS